jgi:hypothetical protein
MLCCTPFYAQQSTRPATSEGRVKPLRVPGGLVVQNRDPRKARARPIPGGGVRSIPRTNFITVKHYRRMTKRIMVE